ncbi:MAG: hypothetical protein ABIZ91_13790 [Gemmatimonadaceae bacterium]
MSASTRRVLSAIAMFVAAVSLQRACTMTWGGTRALGGVRYEFSVIGLSRLQATDVSPAARIDCRWWPAYGDAALCAPGEAGEVPGARLRLAYPLLQVGLWLAIVSLLLHALRVPRDWRMQAALPTLVLLLTASGVVLARQGLHRGLAALAGLELSFNGAGYWFAMFAATLGLASLLLLIGTTPPASPPPGGPAHR